MDQKHDHGRAIGRSRSSADKQPHLVPGKRTLTECLVGGPGAGRVESETAATAPAALPVASNGGPSLEQLFGVQRMAVATRTEDPAQVHAAAARGMATPASPLPYADRIQRAFGRHDISAVQAHTGPEAAASARAMGGRAYATGAHVVLDESADLRTVAHEAAHVIQQRGGVQLSGGVGAVGDLFEQHADAVADRVVQGRSASDLLDHCDPVPAAASPGGSVQRMRVNGSEEAARTERKKQREERSSGAYDGGSTRAPGLEPARRQDAEDALGAARRLDARARAREDGEKELDAGARDHGEKGLDAGARGSAGDDAEHPGSQLLDAELIGGRSRSGSPGSNEPEDAPSGEDDDDSLGGFGFSFGLDVGSPEETTEGPDDGLSRRARRRQQRTGEKEARQREQDSVRNPESTWKEQALSCLDEIHRRLSSTELATPRARARIVDALDYLCKEGTESGDAAYEDFFIDLEQALNGLPTDADLHLIRFDELFHKIHSSRRVPRALATYRGACAEIVDAMRSLANDPRRVLSLGGKKKKLSPEFYREYDQGDQPVPTDGEPPEVSAEDGQGDQPLPEDGEAPELGAEATRAPGEHNRRRGKKARYLPRVDVDRTEVHPDGSKWFVEVKANVTAALHHVTNYHQLDRLRSVVLQRTSSRHRPGAAVSIVSPTGWSELFVNPCAKFYYTRGIHLWIGGETFSPEELEAIDRQISPLGATTRNPNHLVKYFPSPRVLKQSGCVFSLMHLAAFAVDEGKAKKIPEELQRTLESRSASDERAGSPATKPE